MSSLQERDRNAVWHPFTQYQNAQPLIPVARAEGALLFSGDGKTYIDAISSWWVNVHGHAHPYIAEKIAAQAKILEQVIFAGFTHEPAVRLAERVLELLGPGFAKVFFSDDGSTSVEVALKMALQYWHNLDMPRKKIATFENAYHGDTFGAMAVGARGTFNRPFESLLFDVITIPVPVRGKENDSISALQRVLADDDVAAFIFEPLVQGAAGMVMYDEETLQELIRICAEKNVLTIADEVMTGFGRTGKMFATVSRDDEFDLRPDIICLSKGLTGGFLPMGLTVCTQEIFDAFISGDQQKTFFHGHSYTANPLACAAANASLDLFEKLETRENVFRISRRNTDFLEKNRNHPALADLRCCGTILAAEFKTGSETSYFNDLSVKAYAFFLEKGILLRPLGNIVYLMPPYCITEEQHEETLAAMEEFMNVIHR
ncbi:MAG: adenosylmethionine-8-amino-7-oxononanoate aminotransferase [Bacteroidetes bacterium]|nr:MAG: adenosylmethionine-8-amino-7-oxononanoate aminotransferase [Bacteroidota bacterium]